MLHWKERKKHARTEDSWLSTTRGGDNAQNRKGVSLGTFMRPRGNRSQREKGLGSWGYVRSVIEARQKRPSVIMPAHGDVSSYDLVVIGTPVWAWSVSSPVRAYLMANNVRLPAVAFFCTPGARGSENAFAQMQSVTGKAPRAVLTVTTPAVASGSYRESLMAFVRAITPSSNS